MRTKIVLVLLVLFLSVPGPATAQSLLGTIAGHITDSTERPIAGVQVVLVQEATNRRRSAVTSAEGDFVVTLLPPGPYRVEAERDGYRKYVQRVTLEVNQELRLDMPLLPGSISEEVVVTAPRGLLRTDAAVLGTVIDNRQILGLPLDGRNFFELALLAPGTAPAAPGSAGSVRGDFAVNVNGAREDANNFLLDGIYNGDPKLNGIGISPPVDAILEFEVLTSNYDASFGRNAGGQVNVVVKSGANRLHGTGYEFFRNAGLDARNFFVPAGEADPQYQRNQFGASLGGPVRRDRTFFFGDFEGRRVREGITRTTNVPTALERNGDFSRSANPFVLDLFTQRPFDNARIPAERIDPIGRAIAALYPLPNRTGPQNFVSSPALRDRDDHFDLRLDHALARADDLSFRYSFGDRSLFDPFSGGSFPAVPGYGTDIPRRGQNVMLSETHTFSPSLLNEVRLGFNRVSLGSFQQNMGQNLNRQVGLPVVSGQARDTGLSFISVTGFSSLGDEFNNPQHSAASSYQVLDHATLARGRHVAKFGFDFRLLQQNAFRDVLSRGFLSFLGVTGNSLGELLVGFPTVTSVARLDNPQHLRTHSYSFFLQDNYRLSANLTLSAGVRYEYNAPPVDAFDRANVYDSSRQALVRVGTNGIPRSGYDADRNNWGPRVGLAWTPGSRGTVLRAGYGVYYDQSSLAPGEGLYFSPPYFDSKLYIPLPDFGVFLSLRDPFPASYPLSLPSSALSFQRDLRSPYVQHWNFNVQQRLGGSRTLELAYVGSKGTKLLSGLDLNQPYPSPRQPNLRPAPQFDDITQLQSRGDSSYHSFQARLQQRLASGLSLLSSYTWGKSLDDASSFFSSAGDPNFPQDSHNVRAERGRSNFDVRHRLSVAYSYDLPFGRGHALAGHHGWLTTALTGWQSYGILTFQTGRPFTVALLSDLDNSNTGRSILGFGANDRPNLLRNPALSNPAPERWFDTTAFATPPFGQFGNAGRNILDGPGLATVNLSLVKDTTVSESLTVQFRAESFNLLNRTNLDLPDIFVGSPTFGRISSAGPPRRIQFGVKLIF